MDSAAKIILELAADLFEASPRHTWTRAEVVRLLRDLPDEIDHTLRGMAIEEAAIQSPGSQLPS